MGIVDELAALPATYETRCTVALYLAQLPVEDREEWLSVLADPQWRHTQIARVLRNHGAHMSESAIARHRKQKCCCGC